MNFPQIPLEGIILIPVLFISIILLTDLRYDFHPDIHISNGTIFASLVVGFILLYANQKYDNLDLNIPSASRALIYLKKIALEYDPSAIQYLIQFSEDFLEERIYEYHLLCYERDVVPKIKNIAERKRVQTAVDVLENFYNDRVSETNIIPNPIWYLVFLSGLLLTVIFPMNSKLDRVDAILILLLMWLPITIIYALFVIKLSTIDEIIEETIIFLKKPGSDIDEYCENC